MIRTLIYLVIILLGLYISPFLAGNTGYLYISVGDYQAETSIVFAVMALIVFYSLLQLAEFTIIWALNILLNSRLLPEKWRKKVARKHTLIGALALAEEDWATAEKAMIKGADKGELPTLNLLAAARAAQHQNNLKARDTYLAKAELDPLASKAVSTTRIRYLLQQGDLLLARAELDKLKPTSKSNIPVLKLCVELYKAQQDWQALKLILPSINKKNMFTDATLKELTLTTNVALLKSATNTNEQTLEKCWHWLSRSEKKQVENIAQYAIGLHHFGHHAKAIKMLLKQLKTSSSKAILSAVSQILTPADLDAKKQLMAFESRDGENLDYQVCLATVYQKNHDYQNAKVWWQKACYQHDDANYLHALAEAQEQQGELNRALQSRKNAAKLQTQATAETSSSTNTSIYHQTEI